MVSPYKHIVHKVLLVLAADRVQLIDRFHLTAADVQGCVAKHGGSRG